MDYSPRQIQIRATYKCNVKCRHCHNNSHSKQDLIISIDNLMPLIAQATQLGIRHLTLEGGEIFLFPKWMKEVLHAAKQHGLSVAVCTNGFWGKSITAAKNAVQYLKDAGFSPPKDYLMISAGEFHQEWISTETIKTAAEAYFKEFKFPVNIFFEHTPNNSSLLDTFKKIMTPSTYKFLDINTNFYRNGREELPFTETDMAHWTSFGKCPRVSRITVEPTGDVFPCVGPGVHKNQTLKLGNVITHTPIQLVNSAKSNVAVNLINNVSFKDMYSAIKSKHPELPEQFAHPCEMCAVICHHIDDVNN